jgi:FMN phosphatase YigB (HAD superfamily)
MIFPDAIYNGKTEIKNIIFDWGGVITNLHLDATKMAFQELGLYIFDESVPHDPHDELFIPFEIGKISPEEFRNKIRLYSTEFLADNVIDNAWNAMLGELPVERWRLLEMAGKRYRTFLLSNTNAIHLPYYFNRILKVFGTYGYTHLFEKSYFSHELGLRKPNANIYQYVMNDKGIDPKETMFIDDFIENIETARQLGFQTIHLKQPLTLVDFFENGTLR